MRLRALTIDLDDTLWPVLPALERADLAVDAWLRQHHPEVARRWPIAALRALRTEVAAARPDLAHDFTTQRRLTFGQAFAACDIVDAPIETLWNIYFAARNRVELFPDSLGALARLATRWPLASVTNGNADLDRIGLRMHFRHHVCARDIGWPKPDPRIFHAAVERLGVMPAHVLHVGDDPVFDVRGALDAGLRSAWINRSGEPWQSAWGAPPDLVFPDLAELADWLDRHAMD